MDNTAGKSLHSTASNFSEILEVTWYYQVH